LEITSSTVVFQNRLSCYRIRTDAHNVVRLETLVLLIYLAIFLRYFFGRTKARVLNIKLQYSTIPKFDFIQRLMDRKPAL
jgi:hypothetical protein